MTRSLASSRRGGLIGLLAIVIVAVALAILAGRALQTADLSLANGPNDETAGSSEAVDARRGGITAPWVSSGDLQVHFIDVGQADATLLHHRDVTVLVDTGHWQGDDLVGYLRGVGVEHLDLVIATHAHADHLGQFDQVLGHFDVDEVWWSGATTTTRTFERALAALEESDATYHEPRSGEVVDLGSLVIEVINPPDGVDLSNLHDSGIAVRIRFGDIGIVLTGDAAASTEQRMVAAHASELRAEVLQLGHHGSATSTTPQFLEAVAPNVAIWSAAADSPYGHPHREVLERLAHAGIPTFGTGQRGHMILVTDGHAWRLVDADGRDLASHDEGAADGQR